MERNDMVNALHGLFIKGLEVNLNTEEFQVIKIATEEATECTHFTDWVNIFIDEGNIHPDDAEQAKENLNLNHIRKICEASLAPHVYHYRRKDRNGDWRNVAAYFFRSCKWTNENPVICIGIMPLDWLMEK